MHLLRGQISSTLNIFPEVDLWSKNTWGPLEGYIKPLMVYLLKHVVENSMNL